MTGPSHLDAGLAPHIGEALRADGRRIVITGAGGWLGMATLELLDQCLGEAAAGRVRCFGSRERQLVLRDGTQHRQEPLSAMHELAPGPTIVLHYAFLTKDCADAMSDETYADACRALDDAVIAGLDTIGAEAVFVASSGAATKVDDPAASRGMRLYGSLKVEQERRFAEWAERTGHRAVVGRLFNISGPYINKLSSYALSAFILDALAGRPVTVLANRPVIRGYVAIRELVSLIAALLMADRSGSVLFESGGEAMEMARIAADVAAVIGPVEVVRAAIEVDDADRYVGDDVAYRALLAQHGIESVPFAQQVSETADFLAFLQRHGDNGGLAS